MGLLQRKPYPGGSSLLSVNGIFLCNTAYAYGVNGPAEADPGGGRGGGRRDQPVCLCSLLI